MQYLLSKYVFSLFVYKHTEFFTRLKYNYGVAWIGAFSNIGHC